MKLTNNRLYLDYNATAPLDESVLKWLTEGVFPFGNPSSIHNSGKLSKKLINQTRDFLFDTFKLTEHQLFFHSGATEGINDIIKGFCLKSMALKEKFHVVAFKSDHSCIVNQKEHVELLGGAFYLLDVDHDGQYNEEETIKLIRELKGRVLLNHTYINNETGVVWDIGKAKRIKKATNCFVHVDAVQLIGKWKDIYLDKSLDSYTFSAHKFGGLKGIGFTFISSDNDFNCSLIRGGGQQDALRSGTENVFGIYSIKLSLEKVLKSYDFEKSLKNKTLLETSLKERYGHKIIIAGEESQRNSNTTYLIVDGVKTDILITAFDMAGVDLSSGSACSSGAIKPSRVLMSMGYSEEQAKNSIRISFSPYDNDGQYIVDKVLKVFDRFLL